MSPKAPPKPLCCVTIGYRDYLLPMDKGLKVVELMSHAVSCSSEFIRGQRDTMYRLEGPVEVNYTSVKSSQVLPPKSDEPEAPGQQAITLEPLKIGRST